MRVSKYIIICTIFLCNNAFAGRHIEVNMDSCILYLPERFEIIFEKSHRSFFKTKTSPFVNIHLENDLIELGEEYKLLESVVIRGLKVSNYFVQPQGFEAFNAAYLSSKTKKMSVLTENPGNSFEFAKKLAEKCH